MKSIEEQLEEYWKEIDPMNQPCSQNADEWFFSEKEMKNFAVSFAKQAVKEDRKRSKKVNDNYGHFFDRVISDGENPEQAARDLGLL